MWGDWQNGRYYALSFEKRSSVSETVRVPVYTPGQYECWLDHRARLESNNPKKCSCYHCRNPRRTGIGNSAKALTHQEGSALMAAIHDITNDDGVKPPNSRWRKRTWRSNW